jgi:ribonuclease III
LVGWDNLQKSIGVTFKDTSLLKQAFQHASYVNENPDLHLLDNERLEFLGDSILNSIVSRKICQDYPYYKEGELTVLRTLLIREETLAQLASELRLGDYLQLGKGEEGSGGRQRPSNLCDAFEALVGAIFLNAGQAAAETFVLTRLSNKLELIKAEKSSENHKAKLQEFTQLELKLLPSYHLITASGPDHDKNFTVEVKLADEVIGTGSGKSKKIAEMEAARSACQKLNIK